MPGRHLIGSLAILFGLAQPLAAQESGDLLVANPIMNDPNFRETVLLVVHHAADGAIAVALNRPTWVDPQDAFPDLDAIADVRQPLYFGGPNSPNQLLVVFEDDRPANRLEAVREVANGVFVTANLDLLAEIAANAVPGSEAENITDDAGITVSEVPVPEFRVYAGHATWGPGQLESEIAAGAWRVVPGRRDHIFNEDSEALWRSMPLMTEGVTASLF